MTSQPDNRDAAAWAQPVERLQVTEVEPGGRNINVAGRRPDLADPGLRPDVAEDLPRAAARARRDAGSR